ncbi:MAG: 2-oxo acid dehydrogenase subunit E2 [Armatimonadetes bacterium]|nr:2-oxo acid dehydrogenase subunit E2 [Armatimonadota bacterium]
MAQWVRLPVLGQTMEEGTILRWFKQEGEAVVKGEPLAEILTDKVNIEMEAPEGGVLLKILHPADATVPVQQPICILGEAGEDIAALLSETGDSGAAGAMAELGSPEPVPTGETRPSPSAPAEPVSGVSPFQEQSAESPESSTGPLMTSPRARKTALAHGIDLAQLSGRGTGPQGRIQERDVLAFLEEARVRMTPLAQRMAAEAEIDPRELVGSGPGGKIRSGDVKRATEPTDLLPPLPPEAVMPAVEFPDEGPRFAPRETRRVPLTPLRRIIAENIAKSARTAPHVNLTMETDVTELARLRTLLLPDVEKRYGVRLTYTDLLVKATALALREHPSLNSSWDEDAILLHGDIHVGVAVAIPEGLIVPVVRDVDRRPLPDLSAAIKDLAGRARENKLRPDELSGGTFTITNLGGYGVDAFTPIINPPQCAILGVGRIADRPAFGPDGGVERRSFMNLCLSFDHRIVDGAPAAEFLRDLREMLENPYRILI